MSAFARVLWTFGTALPIQRWLGGIMLASFALALLAMVFRWEPLFALSIIATAMYVLGTTFAAGYLLRTLSSPRTHRFLPYFRVRVLAAFLLAAAALSAPAFAMLLLPAPPQGPWVLLSPLILINGVLFLVFAPAQGIIGCALASLAIVLAGLVLEQPDARLARLGITPMLAGIAAWAACWTCFAVWYLRTPAVGPYRWPPAFVTNGRFESPWLADASGAFTRRSAMVTCFTRMLPLRARRRAVYAVLAALGALVWMSTMFRRQPALGMGVLLSIQFLPIFTAPFANQLARRTKLLWLASGKSRRELFGTAERAVWSRHVPTLLVGVLCAETALLLAHQVQMAVLARLLLLLLTSIACAVYMGLAAVRGGAFEYVPPGALVVSIAIGAWAAIANRPHFEWLGAIAALHVASAAMLRVFAIFRWRQIDWIMLRPRRPPSQSLRGA